MLSPEDNETLCRVGAQTPMGAMLRQYWVPVLRSQQLEADGAPVPITVFGEHFVAFRATDGRVGVFARNCPHRCASLALARNEGNGLRCIFHGWKFDVSGKVVEVPTEPAERQALFAEKVKVRHCPVREAGGMVWAFFAQGVTPPKFPEFEFTTLPADYVHVRRAVVSVNWVQAMEAVLDSAHLGMLHSSSMMLAMTESARVQQTTCLSNTAPKIKYVLTPYGFKEAALREQPDGTVDTRIREFVAPWHAFLPLNPGGYRQVVTTIPIDDVTCAQFFIIFRSDRALTQAEIDAAWFATSANLDDIAAGAPHEDTAWDQDRAAMKAGHFTGLTNRHVFYEDFAVLESMGPIVDRAHEHLCQTDATVILARRQLLKSARAFAATGATPWGLAESDAIDFRRIRAIALTLPDEKDWEKVDAFAV